METELPKDFKDFLRLLNEKKDISSLAVRGGWYRSLVAKILK